MPLTSDARKDLVARCYRDPVFYCRLIHADWFPRPMPWVHRGILAILLRRTDFLLNYGEEVWPDGTKFTWTPAGLDKILRHFYWKERPDDPMSPRHPIFRVEDSKIVMLASSQIMLMLPRGYSKTTLVNAANCYMTLFQLRKFVLYVSETGTHAEMQLQNVGTQFETNELMLELWGNIVPDRQSSLKWRDDYKETTTKVRMAARGRGGQIRGLVRDGTRPDLILCDDIEDEDSVKTPEQRQKALKWFQGTLKPARQRIPKTGDIIVLGTALHADALLMHLRNDPQFICCVFGAIDEDGDPLWEDNMSLKQLETEKVSFATKGQLPAYYLEYFNQVRNDDTALFKLENFRYQLMSRTDFIGVSLAQDPAIGDTRTSDYCTFGVVGITEKGQISVLECIGERGMAPERQVDTFFELNNIWRPTIRGVEATAFQKALIYQLKSAMYEKSKQYGPTAYFDIVPIHHKTAKAERIVGILAPRYRAGYIVHQRRFVELEMQLIDYPGKHDDFPDVIAMAIALLDPYAALAADPEILGGDQQRSLELELGEWRSCP